MQPSSHLLIATDEASDLQPTLRALASELGGAQAGPGELPPLNAVSEPDRTAPRAHVFLSRAPLEWPKPPSGPIKSLIRKVLSGESGAALRIVVYPIHETLRPFPPLADHHIDC